VNKSAYRRRVHFSPTEHRQEAAVNILIPEIPVVEKVIRSAVVYLFLLVAFAGLALALAAIARNDRTMGIDAWVGLVLKCGQMNLRVMEIPSPFSHSSAVA
jgi:hypothetical protein